MKVNQVQITPVQRGWGGVCVCIYATHLSGLGISLKFAVCTRKESRARPLSYPTKPALSCPVLFIYTQLPGKLANNQPNPKPKTSQVIAHFPALPKVLLMGKKEKKNNYKLPHYLQITSTWRGIKLHGTQAQCQNFPLHYPDYQ